MTVAYWCVLLAGVLTYVAAVIAKSDRQYDNAEPRAWMEKQQGFKRRAYYAHQNSLEAFPFFAVAVLMAHQLHASQGTIDSLAIAFIVVRCIYIAAYVSNKATLRSLVWAMGMGLVLAIFFAAAKV